MLAYHNDPTIKSAILAQLAKHRKADELIKGTYWENGKGCAVGCTIYSGKHVEYETRFGIPQVLARLEDRLFEGLSNGYAKVWPEKFMNAIQLGANLEMVWPRFALWLLVDELPQRTIKYPGCAAALTDVAMLYREWIDTGRNPETERWKAARKAAYAAYAADAAAYAAYVAAYAADVADAYAAADAADAAYVAADAAAYAAYVAAYAADAAADAAAKGARASCYIRMADKLIELLASTV